VKIFLRTFGCKVNQYETELLRARMEGCGGVSVDVPEDADLCLVNSCSVTAKADAECRQYLRRLLKASPRARIVVTGCYATRAPRELESLSPRVEVYSNKDKDALPACVGFEVAPESFGLARFAERSRAFLKVQDGCRAPCRYCVIPSVRPDSWSKPVEDVVREVASLSGQGYGEIVLTGIRLGLYRGAAGPDVSDGTLGLKGLLERIVRIPGRFRIRLSSLEVTEATDDLLELTAATDKICRHFHIPLQSADDGVLRDMGRWYDFARYAERIASIKSRLPDAGLTTDVLTGFPTETEEAFETTLRRVEELGFTGLHVFPFSPRPGTPAAALKVLPPEVLRRRVRRLISLGEHLKDAHKARHQGTTREVLIEPDNEGWTDNYIRVKTPAGAKPGTLVPVKI
jgi:threonylcarbamoyladenosine tRNA methylthiotransferase MtaB